MPRPSLGLDDMASASPRSRLFCLVSTRGIGTFKLCYDITIHNFHPFILFNTPAVARSERLILRRFLIYQRISLTQEAGRPPVYDY